jgi:hypothetical protein
VTSKQFSRNSPCPCGSGKKYKQCCFKKGIEYTEDDAGTVRQSVPVSDDVAEVLRVQRQKFIDRFGQEPGPDDPIFFDLPHPEHVEHMMAEDMKAAGIDPAIIFAFEKTGRLVTEDNQHLIPENDLAAWDAAIQEYEEKHRRPGGGPAGG